MPMRTYTSRVAGAVSANDNSSHAFVSSAEAAPVGGTTKRCLDVAIAATTLTLLAPIMICVAALAKATQGGPVFFGHSRIGHGGRVFRCWKFRTMAVNGDEILRQHLLANPAVLEEWRNTQKLRVDPRITPLGRMLRMSSIDELPQLLNVLRGEMSCVGPRPIVASELERYGDKAADYLSARPGVTGLWQISGRSNCSYDERVAFDSAYVRDWSLGRDLVILLKTIPAVLRTDRAA